jgi:exopolysaccharide biosynthesis polyprenyl glycosylphosphotransferase
VALFCVFLINFILQEPALDPVPVRDARAFLLSFVPWLYLTLLFSNYLLPRSLGRWAFSGDHEERVALGGTVEQAALLKPWLERKAALGLRTIGIICPQPAAGTVSPFPILGTIDEMDQILKSRSITQLILLDLSVGSESVRRITELCERAAVRLLTLYNFNEYFRHTTTTFEDDGVRLIGLREEPLESPLNRFWKRLMDLAIAVPVVVLVLPMVTFVVWILQRIQSPGPVFFWQVRTGMMGRPFRMLKYRTMHPHNGNEARQATHDDPRIFPAGRWLRKLSLDELPQFVNVLYGNMSVVGPRPHLSSHDEIWAQAMGNYLVRKFVKPGITGWAQVSGFRGEVHTESDIRRRVAADIHYLENWSWTLDCLVILKTALQIIKPPRAAY